jgi:FkbM family methyltransferase
MRKIFVILLSIVYVTITPNVEFSLVDYHNEILAFLSSILPINPVILEAGGHFGEDTIRMKSVWPQATIHTFEPLPSSFIQMVKNTCHLPSVFCYPYALTTFSGKTNFYIDIPNNAASSIGYPVEWNESEFDKTPIQVSCSTINEWARLHDISKIDFMWLDMEGHELYALQHALDILNTVEAIFTEISFEPIREGSCLYTDLKKFLELEGFYEVWKTSEKGRFGDALFMRRRDDTL